MKERLKKFWTKAQVWISKYWYLLAIGFVAVVVICYIAYMKSQRDYTRAEIRYMELKLDVYKKMAELHSLETQRELIKLKQSYTKQEIEEIENKISQTDTKIAQIYNDIAKLSLDEKIERYDELTK